MAPATKKRTVKVIYGGMLSLIFVTILLRYWHQSRSVWSDWMIVLPIVQTVFACLVGFRYRGSRSAHLHNLIASVTIGTMCVTMFLGVFDYIVFRFLDVVVHIGLPIGWLFAAGGVLAVPLCLKRRWHLILKFWLLIVSSLLTAELAAHWLEPSEDYQLEFPGELPSPPPNEIHVAAIGGSSTLGYPYQPKFGFPQVTAWSLQQRYPDYKVVMRNLARGGLNLRLATQEIRELQFRPHVLLIYTGHNEFYHDMEEFERTAQSSLYWFDSWVDWSALFRISKRCISYLKAIRDFRGGRRFLIDKPIATPELYARRLHRFRNQCEQLRDYCRREGIATIWFIPAASESGFEPNRSGNKIRMPADQQAEIETTVRRIKNLSNDEAIKLYQRVLDRVPEFAEFHFRLAECLRLSGDLSNAREHFIDALNQDGHPLRANEDYRKIISETVLSSNGSLVDTIEVLRSHTKDQILGKSLFHDNVHMNLKGYYLTGLAGSDAIIESGALTPIFGPPGKNTTLTLSDAIQQSGLTREDLSDAYRQISTGFLELSEWRFDKSNRHREFKRYQNMADGLKDHRIEPGQEGTESLEADSPGIH